MTDEAGARGASGPGGRQTRPPQAKVRSAVLTREEILSAALDIADRGELDQLTMRHLAAVLGVSAMALYAHVADKDDILDAIIERRLRESGLPAADLAWQAWMAEASERLRQLLVAHLPLLDRYCRRPVGVPAALERMEAALEVLEAAGFRGITAVEAYAAVHTYTIGFASLETSRRMPGSSSSRIGGSLDEASPGFWPAFFGGLDPASFPRLADLRPDLVRFTETEQFRSGLEVLLSGLAMKRDSAV